MNRKPEYEGVVILGAPRSGTTLLRRILNAHPAIASPPETNLLGAAGRFLAESEFAGGLSVGVVPGLAFSGFSEAQVLDELREFLFSFFRRIAAASGKTIWAEKTATDIYYTDAIERICGDRCRYVCITRNALDVIASMQELANHMDAYLPELHAYVQKHASRSEASAHAWRDANQAVLGLLERHPELSCRVKYEDLVKHPLEQLREIFEFLGLEPLDRETLDRALAERKSVGLGDWKTYTRDSVGNDRVGRGKGLDSWTVERIAPVIDPVSDRLGYPRAGTTRSNPENSRRTAELGRMVAAMRIAAGGGESDDLDE